MTNVTWRSRSNQPTRKLRSRSVALAEPPAFLPYSAFVKFASAHILTCSPFCRGNMPEPGSDQHYRRIPIWKAADAPGSAANLFHDAFETVFVRNLLQCSYGKSILILRIAPRRSFRPALSRPRHQYTVSPMFISTCQSRR